MKEIADAVKLYNQYLEKMEKEAEKRQAEEQKQREGKREQTVEEEQI